MPRKRTTRQRRVASKRRSVRVGGSRRKSARRRVLRGGATLDERLKLSKERLKQSISDVEKKISQQAKNKRQGELKKNQMLAPVTQRRVEVVAQLPSGQDFQTEASQKFENLEKRIRGRLTVILSQIEEEEDGLNASSLKIEVNKIATMCKEFNLNEARRNRNLRACPFAGHDKSTSEMARLPSYYANLIHLDTCGHKGGAGESGPCVRYFQPDTLQKIRQLMIHSAEDEEAEAAKADEAQLPLSLIKDEDETSQPSGTPMPGEESSISSIAPSPPSATDSADSADSADSKPP